MPSSELIFLGTGTSHGIPVPSCSCSVCSSPDPKNKRSRASVVIRIGEKNILIDTATEFRLQALQNQIKAIHAVLISHDHADHLHGIDDLRVFSHKKPVPMFGVAGVLAQIRKRFDYIFVDQEEGGGTPQLALNPIEGEFDALGVRVTPINLLHGTKSVLGFRIGNTAYCTDCSGIPESSRPLLEGLDVLVIDALRYEKHSTHFSIDQALHEIERLGPRQAYLTHLCHGVEHGELARSLPPHVAPAYDGLRVPLD